jgi:hypothetical protein
MDEQRENLYFLEKYLKVIGSIFCQTVLQIKTTHKFSFILINAFRFHQCHYFLYKYLRLCYNKSVLNWTFCQLLLCLKKTPIAQNWWAAVGSLSSNFKEEDTNSKKKLKPMLVQRESQDPLHHYQNSY